MIRWVLVVLALAPTGCDRVFGLERPPIDAPEPDALDAYVVPVDAQRCFGRGTLALCLVDPPPEQLVVELGTTTTLDTSPGASALCVPYTGGEPDLCVVGASILQVEGILQAIGARPLVLVGSTITITGAVSVASTSVPAVIGASAGSTACVTGAAPGAPGAGGAGGSFGGRGGNGGDNGVANGGISGPAAALGTPTTLRGGCQGRAGEGSAGVVARGGGAVAILASSLVIEGRVTASGAGGFGGTITSGNPHGGGGGGAGGMIVIDAASFELGPAGSVFANGGGGGEGGGTTTQGQRGADATEASIPARGGTGMTQFGGAGGAGSAVLELDGEKGTAAGTGGTGGGGGGGGGAGVIRFVTPPSGNGVVSPAAS